MKEFNFNYAIPREYKDITTGEIKFALPKGGDKMNVDTLINIQKIVTPDMPKAGCPWLQVFNNGYRVTNDNIDWCEWNGITFSDIDSKWFYNYEKQFDVEKLLNGLHHNAQELFYDNYYCVYVTGSGKGYRILWYWDCERTEKNFLKCALLTERYTRELFYSLGEQCKTIIDYNYKGHKVLDSCSKSIKQGLYVTLNKILVSDYINDYFGYCNLEDINIDDVYSISNVIKNIGSINQSEKCEFKCKKHVKKDDIKYYPHHLRRCIYEALVRLFVKPDKITEEWQKICELLPEQNGHDYKFYINEPIKNKWYERYSNDTIHQLNWLKPFGYEYKDDLEYVYINQFTKSWQHHCRSILFANYLMCEKIDKEREEYIKEEQDKLKDEIISIQGKLNKSDIKDILKQRKQFEKAFNDTKLELFKNGEINVMSDEFLSNFTDKELEIIYQIKSEYYKSRWEQKEFNYLLEGYEKPNDIVTYKMYADFYYRNENNKILLKYDIREDDIQIYSYYHETRQTQWHTFKYGNEYTHWKNSDTFDNKCHKTDLMEAINKFVPRWFGYNCVEEYWKKLDLNIANEELLETWAIRHFKCDDTPLNRFISKTFFIAAVKKQLIEDPTKWAYPHILTIQGPTGCGKTFFLKTMFTFDGKELILNKINPNDPDNVIGPLIAKNLLVQFGEGANLKKSDANTQKEFVDRINMAFKYQKKYENEQTTIYPRVVVCRTSNEDILFNDVSINEGDRRNLLLVCKCPEMACDEKMREQIIKEKDILWATAYKLYLENPDADLQLTKEMFNELANIQEEFKLIKKDDINSLYDEIFNRYYFVNEKLEIIDETSFVKMLERSDVALEQIKTFVGDNYNIKSYINKIPGKWLSNYVNKKYGVSTMKVLKDKLKEIGYVFKQSRYGKLNCKCWIKENIDLNTLKSEAEIVENMPF